MPILNYTTEVPPEKTIGMIQGLLLRKGVTSISTDLKDGKVTAIMFSADFAGQRVNFRLPCNIAGVRQALDSDRTIENRYKGQGQAERVAWRIVKDWVEVQLAFVEANQAQLAEVFLPYVVDRSGKTMFQAFEQQQKQITAGDVAE